MSVRWLWAAFIALALGMMLSGCGASRGGSIPYDVALGAPDAPKAIAVDDNYKLAPLDVVSVNVFQVEDLSKDYAVDQSGNVVMPLLGAVPAIGKSTRELATDLTSRYGQRYLRNPNITVSLKSAPARVVTVEGSVNAPGTYPAVGQMSLIQAIAQARGLTDVANPRRVAVFRTVGGKRMAAAFDLTNIRRGEAQDPDLHPGDIVIVDGSNLKKAQRDIFQTLPILSIFLPVL